MSPLHQILDVIRVNYSLFMSMKGTVIGRVVGLYRRMTGANVAAPSGPAEVRDCLISHLIDVFSHPIYRLAVYSPGANS